MQIPMSKKVEDFKETVIMGLPLKESIYLILAVLCAVAVTCLGIFLFHINIFISIYASVPLVMLIVSSGFSAKNGMTYAEQYKQRKNLKKYGKDVLTYGSIVNEDVLNQVYKEFTVRRQQELSEKAEDEFDRMVKKIKILGVVVIVLVIAGIIALISIKMM